MSDLYKKILAQPKEFRRRLTFAITAFLGIIMFSLWLMVTFSSFKKMTDDFDSEETKNLPEAPSIKDSFGQIMDNLDEISESQIKNEESNIQTESSPNPTINPTESPIPTGAPLPNSENLSKPLDLDDDRLPLEKDKISPSPSPNKTTPLPDINQ